MKNGVDRICAVVLALRIFTRLDESGIKQINFRESIDSVFALLQHRLNDRSDGFIIQVDQQYEETPIVACYADQMNQVIFNLLCNAIDSIEEKIKKNGYQTLTPQISIQMQRLDQKTILIRIQDNGMGISEANALRLFEPFFTTKPAGQGVGLGLATSRRIVEEVHGGKLTYQPLVGGGSEFIIQVPS
jgi:signal transduction histidine kinase